MRDSFVFYSSWLEIIENNYADDIDRQRELLHNIILYGIKGEKCDSPERMFVQQVYAQIDSAQAKHDKRVEAGRKGGKTGSGTAKARYGNKNASKTQANDNVKVNENVNDNSYLPTVNKASDGTRLEAVPPPRGWEWNSKIVANGKNHYRRCINKETGEDKVIQLD